MGKFIGLSMMFIIFFAAYSFTDTLQKASDGRIHRTVAQIVK
jgi:hypothetical protein